MFDQFMEAYGNLLATHFFTGSLKHMVQNHEWFTMASCLFGFLECIFFLFILSALLEPALKWTEGLFSILFWAGNDFGIACMIDQGRFLSELIWIEIPIFLLWFFFICIGCDDSGNGFLVESVFSIGAFLKYTAALFLLVSVVDIPIMMLAGSKTPDRY